MKALRPWVEDHFWQLVSHYKVNKSRVLYTSDISDRTAAADTLCLLCWESDHKLADCALASLSHRTQAPSVNDAIKPSMQDASVVDAAWRVQDCGPGALMAKLDLKAAYHMVPVHSADSPSTRHPLERINPNRQSIALWPLLSAWSSSLLNSLKYILLGSIFLHTNL